MTEGLPERLRLVRTHFDLSANDMAAKFGLKDRRTWERYEHGETRPNSDILAALHDEGVDVNWLLSGEGTMLRLPPAPAPDGGESAEAVTQLDRLYEICIKATLRWYDAAGLVAAPEALAGMITRAARLLRRQPDLWDKPEREISAAVADILDVARDMLAAGGWAPKKD